MEIVTPQEKAFLDVFLHEATTSPFTGPATQALHQIGVEYGDMSYIAWACEQDVPRTSFELGHPAAAAPPLPWTTRESVWRRNMEIQRVWKAQRNTGRQTQRSLIDGQASVTSPELVAQFAATV